jgi:hypothetical protein
LDSKFFLQESSALLVEVERSRPVASTRVTAHERAPGLFVQGIEP